MNIGGAKDFRLPSQGAYTQIDDLLGLRFAARELQLTPRQNSQSLLAGGTRTRFRGRGMEFEEVRHYQAGDDIRSIDWRVTARTQVPHTKVFREERERPVMLMIDQRPSMFFGSRHCFKSVLAAHASALMSWAALAQNDRVGGLIFDDHHERDIRPKRSRHTLLALLQAVQTFNQQLNSPVSTGKTIALSQRLGDLRRITKPGSAIVIISDFHDWDRACTEQLHHLSRHGDVSLLWINDPLEKLLPDNLKLTITDGQRKRALHTQDKELTAYYQQEFQQLHQHLQHACVQTGVVLMPLSTDQSPLTQLQTVFGKRSCRR